MPSSRSDVRLLASEELLRCVRNLKIESVAGSLFEYRPRQRAISCCLLIRTLELSQWCQSVANLRTFSPLDTFVLFRGRRTRTLPVQATVAPISDGRKRKTVRCSANSSLVSSSSFFVDSLGEVRCGRLKNRKKSLSLRLPQSVAGELFLPIKSPGKRTFQLVLVVGFNFASNSPRSPSAVALNLWPIPT